MKTCLVVDDSQIVRNVAVALFESWLLKVSEAEGGQQALDACRRHMPDLIFLDWHMPGMSAVEFIGALRALPGGDHPFILYCVTEHDTVDISRAIAVGANDYILKPFNREMIEQKLAEIEAVA
jgi:two-component system chemotaxis response regulator CheY